ncbi:hypothetical protein H6G17_25105 [Chroococcidiopsis sp. FACHB-1243]|uniref:DUF3291 domain-containing protein n=1 Tax=Chroococcidiopsis sp. [FACHB-1243] TaxID=2692781 RepID=UPI001784D814|nr:DUF3291 domain-containing protein [Chroococcidiopsis sp. [FACHB-1243]]MBD2308752.1 hypothetical protein [Chroococcidiopsis sp. [FACHB-1243]]
MAFVSVTRLKLRSWRYLPPFLRHSTASIYQAKAARGNLQVTTQRHGRDFWRLTVWEDEAVMMDFMRSAAHRDAMPKISELSESASTVYWQQESTKLPNWNEAEHILWEKGRHTTFDGQTPISQ